MLHFVFDKRIITLISGCTIVMKVCQILWNGKTISKRMMPANPVYVTNIKAPEPAVKGMPQKQLRIPWTGINIKIPC